MRTTIFLTSLYLVFGFFACKKDDEAQRSQPVDWTNRITQLYEANQSRITIREGIAGTETMITGNCMPPAGPGSTCKEFPVRSYIYIHELTSDAQLRKDAEGRITRVDSRLIARVATDEEGFFQYRLNSGVYSLFIEDEGKFIAWGDGGGGSVGRVNVAAGNVTVVNPRIIHAVF